MPLNFSKVIYVSTFTWNFLSYYDQLIISPKLLNIIVRWSLSGFYVYVHQYC